MAFVLDLARANVRHATGGPFGAAVFDRRTGRLVSVGVNRVVPLRNSVLHAEIVAIMLAERALRSFRLGPDAHRDCELVTSCEPCAMCLGAVLWSGVTRLVCGATGADARRIGFDEGPVFPASYAYLRRAGLAIVRRVKHAEARQVLLDYAQRGGLIYNG
jgi:tRNA(Arg) A34 adenosine deaminase TadA